MRQNDAALRVGPELSIIVPTLNESGNVGRLIERLDKVLREVAWEVVFVDDDSADGTPEALRQIALLDPRVRVIQRIGRRGLASAVVEGVLSTSAPYIAVMDADLQHDEEILPRMLSRLKSDGIDVCVGSRYVEGGGVGEWDRGRAFISRVATRLSRSIFKAQLKDPMSGFFALRRSAFDGAVRRLSAQGYKILLDLFASSPRPLRFAEVPYTFRERTSGESKLDALVVWEYVMLILDKLIGHIVPVRFVMFAFVGGLGVFVHFLSLWLLHRMADLPFTHSQTAATFIAMTFNYFVNNLLTYRDRRLKGVKLFTGLVSFVVVCSIGVVANVGVAAFAFEHNYTWWLAGGAGALVGAVWNYAASSVFTWGGRKQR